MFFTEQISRYRLVIIFPYKFWSANYDRLFLSRVIKSCPSYAKGLAASEGDEPQKKKKKKKSRNKKCKRDKRASTGQIRVTASGQDQTAPKQF